jgi:hypothetical protein
LVFVSRSTFANIDIEGDPIQRIIDEAYEAKDEGITIITVVVEPNSLHDDIVVGEIVSAVGFPSSASSFSPTIGATFNSSLHMYAVASFAALAIRPNVLVSEVANTVSCLRGYLPTASTPGRSYTVVHANVAPIGQSTTTFSTASNVALFTFQRTSSSSNLATYLSVTIEACAKRCDASATPCVAIVVQGVFLLSGADAGKIESSCVGVSALQDTAVAAPTSAVFIQNYGLFAS